MGNRIKPSQRREINALKLKKIDEVGFIDLLRKLDQERQLSLETVSSPPVSSSFEAMWRTLVADNFAQEHPAPQCCEQLLMDRVKASLGFKMTRSPFWTKVLKALRSNRPDRNISFDSRARSDYTPYQLQNELQHATGDKRRFFRTRKNFLGAGPRSCEASDEVWVLGGLMTPIVLRKQTDGIYKIIGEAYVHGAMHGEALELGIPTTNITII